MGRLPFQVLVLPYYKENCSVSYCVFERADHRCYQFISGGGEDDETFMQAAKREAYEEAKINSCTFIRLTSICYIPTNIFSEKQSEEWGNTVFVVPEYSFGVELDKKDISISHEHIGYKWVSYKEAIGLLKWDSNRTALYELHSRIRNNCL